MTLRRLALATTVPAVLASAIALLGGLQACSSSNDAPAGTGGACGSDPFATTGLDTVKISKAEACARYVAALQKKAESMLPAPCSLTPAPSCPEILDDFEANAVKTNPGLCIDAYSNGSMTNCECRIAAYTTCADFGAKPCLIGVIPKPSGTSCETDAGADSATTDTFDTSPLDDAPAADAADAGGGG